MNLSERLREERERLGMNQSDVCALAGITRKTQFNYETGERLPDAGYLAALASAGVDVLYVLTGQRAGITSLRDGEATLIEGYRALDARGKAGVMALIGGMAPHPAPGVQVQVHGGSGHVVGGTVNMPAPEPVKRARAARKTASGA
jgi:transcriptional regulator with XRE-family HTH domain